MVGGVEQIVTILGFFFLSWSYGFSLLDIFKSKEEHPLYHFLAELAVGLATFSFLSVVLHLLHIPLHVNVYFFLSIIYPVYALIKSFQSTEKAKPITWKRVCKQKELYIFLALILTMVSFFAVFHSGAFGYDYLEDDDPWAHAMGTLYVATEHTYAVDPVVKALNPGYANYLEPYPPTYDALMGVLKQLNSSVVWTLKFFNVLLITLGLAFAFLFLRQYLKSDEKALFGTFMLAVLPSFMSHFIWSQTLAIVLMIVAWYALLKALEDKQWRYPAMITIASALVTQPVVSFFMGIIIILMLVLIFLYEHTQKKRTYKQTKNAFIAAAGGFVLSFVYWGAQIWKWSFSGIFGAKGGELSGGWASGYALQKYAIKDIIFAPSSSRIDQAIGFGLVTFILLVLGVILIFVLWRKTFSVKRDWRHIHMLLWLTLFSYMVFAPTFGFPGWGSSRMWVQLAIPIAIVATEGAFILVNGITKQTHIRITALLIIMLFIGLTSIPAKVGVQTAEWPPGAHWVAPQIEVPAFVSMMDAIPTGSRVFAICNGDQHAIGFDMLAEPWNLDQAIFRKNIINATGEDLVSFLQRHNFHYITMSASCIRRFGENQTTELASRISNTGRFSQIINKQGFLLAQVT